MQRSRPSHLQAVRLRRNVIVPEIEVTSEGTIPVVAQGPEIESGSPSLAAKLAALMRAIGLDERRLRDRMRRDKRFADVADAQFPLARTSITQSEAELLIDRGLADPVGD
jgi:hypothetical protein